MRFRIVSLIERASLLALAMVLLAVIVLGVLLSLSARLLAWVGDTCVEGVLAYLDEETDV